MSRLTIKIDGTYVPNKDKGYSSYDVVQKLGRLEDLEEQGRLIITKYAKGQTVYEVDDETGEINEYKVSSNEVWHDVESDYYDPWNNLNTFREDCPLVFATKEEAEAKLAELKGEGNV